MQRKTNTVRFHLHVDIHIFIYSESNKKERLTDIKNRQVTSGRGKEGEIV